MSEETELVGLLGRRFPTLAGTDAVESLGLYGAGAWAAGAEGLKAHGIPVPARVHAALATTAGQGRTHRSHRGMGANAVRLIDPTSEGMTKWPTR